MKSKIIVALQKEEIIVLFCAVQIKKQSLECMCLLNIAQVTWRQSLIEEDCKSEFGCCKLLGASVKLHATVKPEAD